MPPASGAVVQHFARSIRPARGPCQTLLINSLKKLTSVGRLRSKLETQLEASRSQNAGRSPRSRARGLRTKYADRSAVTARSRVPYFAAVHASSPQSAAVHLPHLRQTAETAHSRAL